MSSLNMTPPPPPLPNRRGTFTPVSGPIVEPAMIEEPDGTWTPTIIINWMAVSCVLFVGLLMFLLGMTAGISIMRDAAVQPTPVPACTDAIADAGGICWGEPR